MSVDVLEVCSADVRSWARKEGLDVGLRGVTPRRLNIAYMEANPGSILRTSLPVRSTMFQTGRRIQGEKYSYGTPEKAQARRDTVLFACRHREINNIVSLTDGQQRGPYCEVDQFEQAFGDINYTGVCKNRVSFKTGERVKYHNRLLFPEYTWEHEYLHKVDALKSADLVYADFCGLLNIFYKGPGGLCLNELHTPKDCVDWMTWYPGDLLRTVRAANKEAIIVVNVASHGRHIKDDAFNKIRTIMIPALERVSGWKLVAGMSGCNRNLAYAKTSPAVKFYSYSSGCMTYTSFALEHP